MAVSPVHLMWQPFQNSRFCSSVPRRPGLPAIGVDLDAGEEADAADVADDREVAQRPDGVEEIGREGGGAREEVLALVDVERGEAGGAGGGVAGIGVAVEELDGVLRARRR